ncbi:MAG: RNA methyltransferase [Flavobacteriales bacterium]|nr:RNA methyltransferase [Flavobacteriales bacterium]
MEILSKAKTRWLKSLRIKKHREASGYFVVEGAKIISEVLEAGWNVSLIVAGQHVDEDIITKAGMQNVMVCTADESTIRELSSLSTPPGLMAAVAFPETPSIETLKFSGTYLYCDGIRDPGNLGTILRCADWFGHGALICSPDCAEVWNAKTLMASMGSFLRVPVLSADGATFFAAAKAKGYAICGSVMDGMDIYDHNIVRDTILVIGNESEGIRPELMAFLDQKVSIPGGKPGQPHAESLNAAMAASILSAEWFRVTRSKK